MVPPKILLVDDEVNILKSLQRLLIAEGFDVLLTDSPYTALSRASQEDFSVIVSDQRMPQMEGTELLKQIKLTSPSTIRILLTGYADMDAATSAINDGAVYRFLAKPWNDEELVSVLLQAVQQYEIDKETNMLYFKNQKLKAENELLTQKNVLQEFENQRLMQKQDLYKSYLGA